VVGNKISVRVEPTGRSLCEERASFTNLSHHILPFGHRSDSTDFMTGPFLLIMSVFVLSFLHYSFCFHGSVLAGY